MSAESLSLLLRKLDDPSPEVRRACVERIAEKHAKNKAVVERLIRLLQEDSDDLVRWEAASALGRIGSAASKAVPMLVAILNDHRETSHLRKMAAVGLRGIGGPAVLAALIAAARSGTRFVKRIAAGELHSLQGDAALVVRDIVELLPSVDDDTCRSLLGALGHIGAMAVVHLRGLLTSADDLTRVRAAAAILCTEPWHRSKEVWTGSLVDSKKTAPMSKHAREALHALRAGLNSAEPRVRRQAIESLWEIEDYARPAYAEVLACRHDPDSTVRGSAIHILAGLTRDPRQLVDLLIEGLHDEDQVVRHGAACAMCTYRVDKRLLVPKLIKCLEDDDVPVAASAAEVLASLELAVPKAIPILRRRLEFIDDGYYRSVLEQSLETLEEYRKR